MERMGVSHTFLSIKIKRGAVFETKIKAAQGSIKIKTIKRRNIEALKKHTIDKLWPNTSSSMAYF
jgi:hypothetical protein